MTVAAVDTGLSYQIARNEGALARASAVATEDLAVGQLVEVTVLDQSGAGRYGVRINGQRHSADSTTTLQPGSTVLAVVTGVGDRVELRAISSAEDPELAQALAALAGRYRVEMSAAFQRQMVTAAGDSEAPLATLRAGLYLQKLGEEATPEALTALLGAQRLAAADSAAREHAPAAVTNLGSGSNIDSHGLAQLLEHVLAPRDKAEVGSGAGSGAGDSGAQQRQPQHGARDPDPEHPGSNSSLAQDLLSLSDGGALEYRYATLPLLVGGKLLELDMALFQQKSTAPTAGSPRRLVMALSTAHLGSVRLVASSLNSNLSVSLSSTSERGVALLSGLAQPMGQQLAAIGWRVDAFRIERSPGRPSPAADIVEHVLSNGSLDRAV